jgi:Tannase-like family of unknown function (DUF6351)
MQGNRFVRGAFAVVSGLVFAAQAGSAPQILVLSNRADLISGGDALVEIVWPAGTSTSEAQVDLNGVSVKAAFATRNGHYTGLVTGLQNGDNVLTASAPGTAAQITITNHPITGPVISGPHIAPYECRLTQNNLVATGDADCSAWDRVDYFYASRSNGFRPLTHPTGKRPRDMLFTTTSDGNTVPYIVRVASGTINRGVYRLAMLDNPGVTPFPGPGWNGKLVVSFGCCGAAQYNQGVQGVDSALSDRELSRGFAFLNSTELWNNQHANPHLQGETLMMLKEQFIEHIGMPKWTVGVGDSGGSIQQYLIAQLFPGLLDGIQGGISFPETLMPNVFECRLANAVFQSNPARWTAAKQVAIQGFNASTCDAWDFSFASALVRADATAMGASGMGGCGVTEPENVANVYNVATQTGSIRCDVFQTNANLLGTDAQGRARRPIDNVGVQYGLGALNRGEITVADFLDFNAQVGGFDGDGYAQAARHVADPEALRLTYEGGFVNGFNGPGLANVPIITLRANASNVGDIHDTMQDLIIRARLQRANGRADNQVIWTSSGEAAGAGFDVGSTSLDVINAWLDNIAADPAPASIDKVVRNKPPLASDACWDKNGIRIAEPASTNPTDTCNVIYPRFSTLRLETGEPLVQDVMKCHLKPIDPADYPAGAFSDPANFSRLNAIFPSGVCDWSQPSVGQVPATAMQWSTYSGGPGFVPLGSPPVSQ